MKAHTINRRNLLKSAVAAAIGTTVLETIPASAKETEKQTEAQPEARNETLKSPFVATRDGTQLYYKDWGKGPTALFVHSWGVNSDVWQYQMNDLCEAGTRCVAYDRRGHGRSSQPWNGYDFDTLAADLNRVIETLNLDKLTLVSHSMAGGEIVRYLTKYGARRVSKIILTAPTLPFALKTADNPKGIDKSFFEQFRRALKNDLFGTLRAGVAGFFGEKPNVSPDTIEWGLNQFHQTSLRALLECNRSNTETDFRAELRNIVVPTLLVHGDQDISAPLELTAAPCAELIPKARLKVYKNAPHGIMLTHKTELTRDISKFIQS